MVKVRALFTTVLLLTLAAVAGVGADEVRKVPVQFPAGGDSTVMTGKIEGRDSIIYTVNARDGQFLTVSLRPDNQSADFNIYIPGRGPGDEALYASALGGNREYLGQLYMTGDHQIAVFLNRAAARQGQLANFDLAIRVTDEKPEKSIIRDDEESPATPAPSGEAAWAKEEMAAAAHGPLLERQGRIPLELSKDAVGLAVTALSPDLMGVVGEVSASYDSMESPSEVVVTVTETGIMDDDLLGVRHSVSLAKNRNGQWRIVGYEKGELRRKHLQ